MREAGIKSFAFFIYGYPGETVQTMDQTTRYAIELDPDFANFYPAVPYPGTALYEKCVRDGLLRPEEADWSKMEYWYYLLRGNGLDDRLVMDVDQPRQAPLLPAPRLHRPARRRRRQAGDDEAGDRLAGAVAHDVRRPRRGHHAQPARPALRARTRRLR